MNNFEKNKNKVFKKIYKYIQKQDLTKLHKFIIKESNKNVKKRNKKHRIEKFIRKNLTSKYRKIIDLMAEQLAGLTIFDNDIESALILGDKEEVKKYYERKVANEEE